MGILYKLDFASGKAYIGITRGETIAHRMAVHKSCATARGSQLAIHRAWRKYGTPQLTVLAIATGDFLPELEQRAICAYGTYGSGGYNMTPGGEFNTAFSAEVRAKISKAATGRITSAETKAKLSAIGKLHVFTVAHRANIAAAKTGSKHSPKTLAKLSAAKKGKPCEKGSVAKWNQQHDIVRWAFGVSVNPEVNLR